MEVETRKGGPMAEPLNIDLDKIKEELKRLRELPTEDIAGDTFNMILLGELGVGKTSLFDTLRKPVLVHSFDPGGCKLHHLKPLIESGDLIYDPRYEKEQAERPTAYMAWEREFMRLRQLNVFHEVGTYCLDSFTTWLRALVNETAKRNKRPHQVLQIQDWQVVGNCIIDNVKLATALPCDFVMTGHLMLEKDEVSGRMITRFKSIPSLKVDVPLLFDEIYVLEAQGAREGVKRHLITQSTGQYIARTRIGSGVFDVHEEPNILDLLVKAGMVKKEDTSGKE